MDPQIVELIRAEAHRRTRSRPNLTDDAIQEGLIAFWTAWQHRPGDKGYAFGAARQRILGVVRGDHLTGEPSRQGRRQVDEHQLPADRTMEEFARSYAVVEAELAYHRAEIAAAVAPLTERQKSVVSNVAFGVPLTSAQRSEWSARLRPRLAQRLEHLRGVV